MNIANQSRVRGFTLLEVLVAMALTVVVASIAYSGLSSVLDSLDRTRTAMDRTVELNRALRIMSRDIRFSVDRSIRDELGFTEEAMIGGDSFRGMLGLTRSGWLSVGTVPRSELERVYYYLDDGTLYRMRSTVLDRGYRLDPDNPSVLGDGAQPILTQVERFDVVFLPQAQVAGLSADLAEGHLDTSRWVRDWGLTENGTTGLPTALEVRLRLSDLGEIERLYVYP